VPRQRRDHYLPAAYVGRFSAATNGGLRDRRLIINDRRAPAPFAHTAQKVAFQAGLYDLPEPDSGWLGEHIDLWGYESGLPQALDQIATSPILDAVVWMECLIPFVAGLFSRGPDANRGHNNEGRIRAFQEMLAPVMDGIVVVVDDERELLEVHPRETTTATRRR